MPKNIQTFFADIRKFSESDTIRAAGISDEKLSRDAELSLKRAETFVEEYDRDLNEIEQQEFGLTPLQFCCLLGSASIATALILKGANPETVGLFEETAEKVAEKKHREELATLIRSSKEFKKDSATDDEIEGIKSLGKTAIIAETKKMRDLLNPRSAAAGASVPSGDIAEAEARKMTFEIDATAVVAPH
jgi:hypothetical protein